MQPFMFCTHYFDAETDDAEPVESTPASDLEVKPRPTVDYVRINGELTPRPRGRPDSKFRRDPKTGNLTQD